MASNDPDCHLAFRSRMDEAFAASLSLRSPSSPAPIARCGFATVIEDDTRNASPEFTAQQEFAQRHPEKPHGKGIIYKSPSGSAINYRKPNEDGSVYQKSLGDGGKSQKPMFPNLSPQVSYHAKASGEGSSNGTAVNFRDDVVYRLYFKGLVSQETIMSGKKAALAGIGVAICDQKDNLLLGIKRPLLENGISRQAAEVRALVGGLIEAVSLGIKRIAVYCDYFPIYQFITGKWTPKQKKLALLLDHVHRLRSHFAISRTLLVARKDVKFSFKLAREAIISQINTSAEAGSQMKCAPKETCVICLEDTDVERIFSIDKCSHRYCFSCIKQYVEVKLLHGSLPKCPHEKCESKLNVDSCGKVLTPKLLDMWKQRVKEASIPLAEKVYCPHPRCSALMTKSEVLEYSRSMFGRTDSGARKCLKCHGLFCINCKVPWHTNLTCSSFKKLNPDPPVEDVKLKSLANSNLWRQCVKCQHMIELSEGCYHMTCRCGYEFCYKCGAEWKDKAATCSCPLWDEDFIFGLNGGDFHDYEENIEGDDYYDYDYDYDYDDYFGYDHPYLEYDFDDLPLEYASLGFGGTMVYPIGGGTVHSLFEGEDFNVDDEGFPVPTQDGVAIENVGDWYEGEVDEVEIERRLGLAFDEEGIPYVEEVEFRGGGGGGEYEVYGAEMVYGEEMGGEDRENGEEMRYGVEREYHGVEMGLRQEREDIEYWGGAEIGGGFYNDGDFCVGDYDGYHGDDFGYGHDDYDDPYWF